MMNPTTFTTSTTPDKVAAHLKTLMVNKDIAVFRVNKNIIILLIENETITLSNESKGPTHYWVFRDGEMQDPTKPIQLGRGAVVQPPIGAPPCTKETGFRLLNKLNSKNRIDNINTMEDLEKVLYPYAIGLSDPTEGDSHFPA